jgi:hypothetical protein
MPSLLTSHSKDSATKPAIRPLQRALLGIAQSQTHRLEQRDANLACKK